MSAHPARRARILTVVALGALLTGGVLSGPAAAETPAASSSSTPSVTAASVSAAPIAPAAPTEAGVARSSEADLTGEVIVKFVGATADDESATARAAALTAARAAVETSSRPKGVRADTARVTTARARPAATAGARSAGLAEERTLATGATLVTGATPATAQAVADALSRQPGVAYAEPDRRLRTAIAPDDPYFSDQWNLASPVAGSNVPAVWPRTSGAGAVVAVVDTGVVSHPELTGRMLRGYDFIGSVADARDSNGRDADPTDEGDWQTPADCGDGASLPSSWHGTHVSGIIAAERNNGIGIAGIASDARILPVRAIGRCGGRLSDIADAITWASGGEVRGVPANATPAKVVNLSLGGISPCTPTLRAAVSAALDRGSVLVAAAGNDGSSSDTYTPGNCPGVIDVAALTSEGGRASYSNHGPQVALAAPGGGGPADGITSSVDLGTRTATGPGYSVMYGTSMAAPHVSGVSALLVALRPQASPSQVRSYLLEGVRPFAAACIGCGAGMLDAGRSVAAIGR